MNIVIPITNLRPPLVQGLVPKHTQKDEYTHANPTGTHTHIEQDLKKIRFIRMQKIISVFPIWRGQGFNTVGKRL